MRKVLLIVFVACGWRLIATAQPTITSFSPTSGAIGISVIINGSGFSSTPTNNVVYFGATRATVTGATVTQLTVTVPVGATYQPITVTYNGFTAISAAPFSVTFPACPTIDASTFAPKYDLVISGRPRKTAIGDLNNDGKPDLAIANNGGGFLTLVENTAVPGIINASSFASPVDIVSGTECYGVAIGDLDGDGKPDVAVCNRLSNNASVFQNLTNAGAITAASFSSAILFASGGQPYDIGIDDLDGDGRPDLVTSNYFDGTISVFRNVSSVGILNGSSFAAKVDYPVLTFPYRLAIQDFDGDGRPDIAVANVGDHKMSILRNISTVGSINLDTKVDFDTGTNPENVFTGDVDLDGKPDIVAANSITHNVSVFRNTATVGAIDLTSFAPKQDFASGLIPYSAVLGNLNGDNKPDLVAANRDIAQVSVLQNTSTPGVISSPGSFAPLFQFSATNHTIHIAIGDIDGDGKPEIGAANFNGNSISILRNTIPDLPTEPVAQPSAIIFSSVTTSSFTVSYSAAAGSPDGYLVLRKTGSAPVTAIPQDGTNYSIGNTIGDGTVAYVGAAFSFFESSLAACTDYYYQLYSYEESGVCKNYLQLSPLSGNQVTAGATTPSVSLAAIPAGAICSGTSVMFTATPTNTGGGTVVFDFMVNGISAQSGPSALFTSTTLANGDIVASQISITGGTCLTSTTATSGNIAMTVNPLLTPAVALAAGPAGAICAGTSVLFTATPSSTGGGTVVFDFMINGITAQSGPSATFTSTTLANGDMVTCQISITGGTCLTSTTATSGNIAMTVNPLLTPVVALAASPAGAVCAATSVMFTATPSNTGGGTVVFDFMVNGISAQSGPSASFTSTTLANGDIVASQISITGGTCLTSTTATSGNITMTVNPLLTPVVALAASPAGAICAGTSVMFTATPSNTGGGTVVFDFMVNGISAQAGPSATFTSTTLANGDGVTCQLIITAGTCLTLPSATSAGTTMVVYAIPVVTDPPDQTVCGGDNTSVVFSGTGTTNDWTNSDTSIGLSASGSGNIGTFAAINDGTTTIISTILVTPFANGCTGPQQSFTITVNPRPTVNNIADQALCGGGNTNPVLFTGGLAGSSYNWTNDTPSIGLAAVGSGNIASFVGINAGSSSIVATINVTPQLGSCFGSNKDFRITVGAEPPTPVITEGTPTITCTGGNVTFTSSSALGNQWYVNGNEIPGATSQTFIVTSDGDYTVIVLMDGCSSGVSNTAVLNSVMDAPTITSVSPNEGIPGTEITITGTNFSPIAKENTVYFGEVYAKPSISTSTSLVVRVPDHAVSGKLLVKVCSSTESNAEDFTVPTIQVNDLITPHNKDGINDQFKIENVHLTFSNKVRLLDRYGAVVKEWDDFRNTDDPSGPNTPGLDVSQLSPGNYICILQYKTRDGGPTIERKQMITILP